MDLHHNNLLFVTFALLFASCTASLSSNPSQQDQSSPSEPTVVSKITITSFNISSVSPTGFDVSLNFTGDENSNSSVKLYYCNQTDDPICSPTFGSFITLTKAVSSFTGSVSGLTAPNDSGDVLSVEVLVDDTDGVESLHLTSLVTLSSSLNSSTFVNYEIKNLTSSSFNVILNFTGDYNNNSSAYFYYCNHSSSPGCDPLVGDSVEMTRLGSTYQTELKDFGASYSAGDELNVIAKINDSDAVLGTPEVSKITLVSGLDDYPNTSGLIALWPLNETSAGEDTVVVDVTGKHNGLLKTGSEMGADKSASGAVGGSIEFDGTDDYVLIPGHSDFDKPVGAKMTYMGWVYRNGALSDNVFMCIAYGASNSSLAPVINTSQVGYYNGYGLASALTSVSFDTATWHHFVVTYDAGAVKIYWDGIQVNSGSFDDSADLTDYDFRIAADNWGYFSAIRADEVSFWKRVLTAKEIKNIYDTQK